MSGISGQNISQEQPSAQAQQLLQPGTSFMEDVEQSVPYRFEKQVAAHSNRLAIKTRNDALTYDALNKAANRVARVVLEKCGDSDRPVVVIFDHDAPILVAVLGVLKAGKTCVVLDHSYPEQRAGYIIEDSQATLVLTNSETLPLARKFSKPEHLIFNIDEIDSKIPAENLGLSISADDIAFILYTSGSTGQPKGVIQNHRNVVHNAMRYASGCRIGPDDRVTLLASLGTGQGTPTAFSALLSGAALYPLHVKQEGIADLAGWLRTEEITVYISTPSLFRNFVATLSAEEQFPALRTIRLGAEQIRKSDIELYKKYFFEKCRLALFLSATEAGNLCQYFVDKETEIPGDIVPAGRPVDGVEILLLDEAGKEVGPNETGEIVVRSRFISPGYWRKPELTQAVFLPDPQGGDRRIYHTGDLGRILPDGSLEHLGRKDSQLKIRGYRVEIAEIESALLKNDGIKEVVVVALKDGPGEMQLAAYVVPAGQPAPSVSGLRSFLKETLPDYMIPAAFVMLDALPLNPTGKVDRQALPRPSRERSREDTPFVRPFETVEHQLAQIWEELLGVRPIGIRDNFFELGGDSLLAARMMHRVEQVCGQKVPLATLFVGATIEQLAKALIQQRVEDDDSLLVQVQPGGAKRPLFFVHGDTEGGGFYCLNLARGLGQEQPFYALTPYGVDGGPIPPTIEAIAASYIEMVRAVQPKGPYLLGGLCKGGMMAYEMARQLQGQAEQVDLLVMVGSVAWNTNFRFLQRVVSGVGYLLGLGPEERTRLFLVLRDHWIYRRNELRDDWIYKRKRLKQVATLSFGEQLAWAFRLVRRAARWLARRILPGRGHEISVTRAGPGQQDPTANLPHYKHLISVGYNIPYYKQLSSYVPGPYSGRVVLFWAAEEPVRHPYKPAWRRAEATDPTLGWGRVASDLEIEILPGVTNTSITKDVKILAEQMKSCMDKVHANGRRDKS